MRSSGRADPGWTGLCPRCGEGSGLRELKQANLHGLPLGENDDYFGNATKTGSGAITADDLCDTRKAKIQQLVLGSVL